MQETVKMNVRGGDHVRTVATDLVALAGRMGRPAECRFNDVKMRAEPGWPVDKVLNAWETETAARDDAYRNSPEGRRMAAEMAQRRVRLQAQADAAMARLPDLDFSDPVAVLDFLRDVQEPSDHIVVAVDGAAIISAFLVNGYEPGVYCGDAYDEADRDRSFRWLVGQCLDTLKRGSIHPIVHKFAAEWKAKFAAAATP